MLYSSLIPNLTSPHKQNGIGTVLTIMTIKGSLVPRLPRIFAFREGLGTRLNKMLKDSTLAHQVVELSRIGDSQPGLLQNTGSQSAKVNTKYYVKFLNR